MGKTLVIAEKPSVGKDLARVLPGAFAKKDGVLESPEYVITWAIGHLVQLAEPDEYDKKYKRWRVDDLPIVPDKFKLIIKGKRERDQMKIITRQFKRDDVDEVVNACDAGREGELIFAYTYQKGASKLPVKRLWLSSMTDKAIKSAFEDLRPGSDMDLLEAAARSRSEADWIVGMNATRVATIRLRTAFDGAVSLGRVQTPTLALIAAREEEIKNFKPEPYWLVDATFKTEAGSSYIGRYYDGTNSRLPKAEQGKAVVDACTGKTGEITELNKKKKSEIVPLLYDLTALQREANTTFGFSARRTLSAAQRLYEEHKALTYPRTNSRYLPNDMAPEIKPIAELLQSQKEYKAAAEYVTGLDLLPLGRVVNDAKVTDHHAIIPTRSQHDTSKMGSDDKKVYDLVVRRFLAAFHPKAVFEQTTLRTVVGEYTFRTSGRIMLEAGWRGVYGEFPDSVQSGESGDNKDARLPKLEQGESVSTEKIESVEKETKPPRRYSDASLLAAMETAGKFVEEEDLREALKESGIGTPATRASIMERLINVGYIEREGRSLVCTDKGLNVIRLLGEHQLTSPGLTGEWEKRLLKIEKGEDSRKKFMDDIAKFIGDTVSELDKNLEGVRIPRANLGPCPVCGNDINENRKGYSCWSKEDPGCGFVIWKGKSGKQLPVEIARRLIKYGSTDKQVTGFKSRAGRNFRAKLALWQNEEGKWRVEFNEPWATEGARAPSDEQTEEAAAERDAQSTSKAKKAA